MKDREAMKRAMMGGAGVGLSEAAMGAGMGGAGGSALSRAARGLGEGAMRAKLEEEESMMERLKRDAEETARSYGKAYKEGLGMKKGGKVKGYAKGGSVSSASKRADGCAIKGKTKGRFV